MRRLIMSVAVACALPLLSVDTYATPPTTAYDFVLPTTCAGGGTRESDGSWDSYLGTLSFTTKLTNCIDASSTTHDGVVAVTGSLLPTATGYTMDITYLFLAHYANSNEDVQRNCTWHKVGTYDTPTHKFQGTITKSDCTLTETDTEGGDIVEHLQKLASQTE